MIEHLIEKEQSYRVKRVRRALRLAETPLIELIMRRLFVSG